MCLHTFIHKALQVSCQKTLQKSGTQTRRVSKIEANYSFFFCFITQLSLWSLLTKLSLLSFPPLTVTLPPCSPLWSHPTNEHTHVGFDTKGECGFAACNCARFHRLCSHVTRSVTPEIFFSVFFLGTPPICIHPCARTRTMSEAEQRTKVGRKEGRTGGNESEADVGNSDIIKTKS